MATQSIMIGSKDGKNRLEPKQVLNARLRKNDREVILPEMSK